MYSREIQYETINWVYSSIEKMILISIKYILVYICCFSEFLKLYAFIKPTSIFGCNQLLLFLGVINNVCFIYEFRKSENFRKLMNSF